MSFAVDVSHQYGCRRHRVLSNPADRAKLTADKVWQAVPAGAAGRVAYIDLEKVGSALSFSTVLSVPYALSGVADVFAEVIASHEMALRRPVPGVGLMVDRLSTEGGCLPSRWIVQERPPQEAGEGNCSAAGSSAS